MCLVHEALHHARHGGEAQVSSSTPLLPSPSADSFTALQKAHLIFLSMKASHTLNIHEYSKH